MTAGAAIAFAIAAGAAFSFYQLGSPVFACGRDLAGWETLAWLALAGLQGLLYLFAFRSPDSRRLYRTSQLIVLGPLLATAALLALAHPRAAVLALLGASFYWIAVAAPSIAAGRRPPLPASLAGALAETVLFLLAALVVHTGLAFVVLHLPGRSLDDRTFAAIALVSAAVAAVLVRREAPSQALGIGQLPPLALLLAVLLRAKLPDGSYDALLYKSTIPMQIADWRTALTGAFDHTLLGTNFAEILVAQLRIADAAYAPALTSSLAFAGLWIVAPLAAWSLFRGFEGETRELASRAAALLMVSISEPLLAAGTAYHEPLMSLLMAAALLPMSVGWVFLAAAVAVKVTVVFALPVLVALRLAAGGWDPASLRRRIASRPLLLAAALGLCLLLVGEQVVRNLAMTGRVIGVTETLAGLTDPGGRVLGPLPRPTMEQVAPPTGRLEMALRTMVHVVSLDRWITPTEWDFHVLPSSRLAVVAALLALIVLAFPALRRDRRSVALVVLWAACGAFMLAIVLQGRYFAPLSFAAALVIAHVAAVAWRDAHAPDGRARTGTWLCLALALAACGDQLVGSLVNNGWECRRTFATLVAPAPAKLSEVERRLAQVVAQYRAHVAGGVPPTLVCEDSTQRKSYLGAHHVYAYPSTDLLRRYLDANPAMARLFPISVLAVCFRDAAFAERMIPAGARADYAEIEPVGDVRILVSRPLTEGMTAASLPGASLVQRLPIAARGRGPVDLVAQWERARLLDLAPADTPTRKGAFVAPIDERRTAVMLSPHRVAFDALYFAPGDRLAVELAMPFPNSDGMSLALDFETPGTMRNVTLEARPKPADPAPLAWRAHEVAVPEGIEGFGRLTLRAISPSGDESADWLYLRRLTLSSW